MLRPLLTTLRPKFNAYINQTAKQTLRPTIKMSKNKFQITLDVHNFSKDELKVKARAEYVIIHGKQERETKTGYIRRQFIRKFKLPSGCRPDMIKSVLSEDGILTVSAHREVCEINLPCEQNVPILLSSEKKDLEPGSFIQMEEADKGNDPCASYKNVPLEKRLTVIPSPDKDKGVKPNK